MAREKTPDIVVRDKDGGHTALVAEIRVDGSRVSATVVEELKRYMLNTRCPVGLLVTPKSVRFFVDSFRDFSTDSIEELDAIDAELLLEAPVPTDGDGLERAVRRWLERTSQSWSDALPTSDEAAARVIETLVPAVAQGVVSGGR